MDEELNEDLSSASAKNDTASDKSSISADLIRGHINTIILRTLYDRDKYGYEIMNEIEQKSHGQYELKQPTLYSALKRLETQGYIKAYWKTDEISSGGRRKYFTLTESGREVTERNQAEWEYSRTVIDNLISNKSFDFSQPAPTVVDFRLLKQSTSRIPSQESNVSDDEQITEVNTEVETVETTSESNISEETIFVEQVETTQPEESLNEESVPEAVIEYSQEQSQPQVAEQPVDNTPTIAQLFRAQIGMEEQPTEISEEEKQRRIAHENYVRLVSQPATPQVEPKEEPINIYTNRPAAERDYRNLINNLYVKTLKNNRPQQNAPQQSVAQVQYVETPNLQGSYSDVYDMAGKDGLLINTAQAQINSNKPQKPYAKHRSLLFASLITFAYLAIIGIILAVNVGNLGTTAIYPIMIFLAATLQLGTFSVLYFMGYGKNTRRPTNTSYLATSTILTIFLILIASIVAFLMQVNFTIPADIVLKLVIPNVSILAISVYSVSYYFLTK